MKYKQLITETPQSEAIRDDQVANNAGGFVFEISKWQRLERFLILGSDAPTYYQKAGPLTRENAKSVVHCYAEDSERTVRTIVEISNSGRAPKNDPAIFALALGAADEDLEVRRQALAGLEKVCRTSTHLFAFVDAVRSLGRGWGRTLKRAVANWYDGKSPEKLAYQAIKYRAREGYTHKRLLQTAHPEGDDSAARKALYRWVCEKEYVARDLPELVGAHLQAMKLKPGPELNALAADKRLPWEALPTDAKKDPELWKALLPDMGLTALIRNLGAMTVCGALDPMSEGVKLVVDRLRDEDDLRKSRVHPFTLLQAHAVYASGRGVRGSLAWKPNAKISGALDRAFYAAFANVKPTGKRIMLALDVSSSMSACIMGSPLTCSEASAALSLVTETVEDKSYIVGFTSGLTPLDISSEMSLDDVVNYTNRLPFGGTDCALPMLHALEKRLEVDAFVIYTDNETWCGDVHPVQALRRYRAQTGIAAKLVVVGMTATKFSIADPKDAGMLDIVGFDGSCPQLISDFIAQ